MESVVSHQFGRKESWGSGGQQSALKFPDGIGASFELLANSEGNHAVERGPLAISWASKKSAAVTEARWIGPRFGLWRQVVP